VRGRRRLAGARGPHHHDKPVEAGDRLGGRLLGAEPLNGARRAGFGPPLEFDLLVERLAGGEQPISDRFADRSAILRVGPATVGPTSTQRVSAWAARRSMCSTMSTEDGAVLAGTRLVRCRAMSARSQVADSSWTRRSASRMSASSSRTASTGGPTISRRVNSAGSKPLTTACSIHSSWRNTASMPWDFFGRDALTARRSSLAIV
jgi:hypothetical protein